MGILDGLNDQQQAAVTAADGPVLVLAGPGSGKTRVLTHRIAYLVEQRNIYASHIMAVTFTNKAAREMENRVIALLGGSGRLDGLSIGTFHAICARVLRQEADYTDFSRDYAIFDTADQLDVMKQVMIDLNFDPKRINPRALLNMISAAKNELIGPHEYNPAEWKDEKVRRAYLRYDELLHANNARDFDDLLVHTARLFQDQPEVLERYQRRYWHVLVDEFQDTNMAQYVLVKLLAGERRNLFAVGDPDQSIYAFRGADYRNVRRFRQDYPDAQVILLEENYRSHQAILDAATGVIDQNTDRQPKSLFSRLKKGPKVHIFEAYNEDEEAQYIVETIAGFVDREEYKPGDFAVMYRTNAQSRALEEGFRRVGMRYQMVGATRFYGRREIKDVLAYLRLIQNPDDNVSLQRVINVPPRGIGAKTLESLDAWAADLGVTAPQALMLLLDEKQDSPFTRRARNTLSEFARQLDGWRKVRHEHSPDELIEKVLQDTGYHSYLTDGTAEGVSRFENVMELHAEAGRYRGLPLVAYLETVSLVSDVDSLDKKGGEPESLPTLLTLHSAKGLEFPVVFIAGVEENILPHARSIAPERKRDATVDEREAARREIEEERRLFYVGITRAQLRLYLVYATRRTYYGGGRDNTLSGSFASRDRYNPPSRFLFDIPEKVREGTPLSRAGKAAADARHYQEMTSWDSAESATSRSASYSQPTRFKAASCVWTPKYGEGVVVRSRVKGGIEEVDVLFPGSVGEKTIIADFLRPMEDK